VSFVGLPAPPLKFTRGRVDLPATEYKTPFNRFTEYSSVPTKTVIKKYFLNIIDVDYPMSLWLNKLFPTTIRFVINHIFFF